jgi:hypothetical protein
MRIEKGIPEFSQPGLPKQGSESLLPFALIV